MRTGLKSLACGMALALGVLASGCEGDPPVETSLLAEFLEPADGVTFTLADDVSESEDGVQVKVVLRGQDSGGRDITLSEATLEVTSDQVDAPVPLQGVVSGDSAEFTVTLGNGPNRLVGRVVEEGSRRDAVAELDVTLVFERPDVVSVTFPRDADDNGWHNLAELPGLPAGSEHVLVRVTTVRMEVGAGVRISTDDAAGTALGQGTVDATGVAEILLDQLSVQEVQGELRVELTNLAGVTNRVSETSGGESVDEEAVGVAFKVDRVPPVVELLSPLGGVYGETPVLTVSVRVGAGLGAPPLPTVPVQSSLPGQPALAPLTLVNDAGNPALWTAAEQRTFEYGVHDLTVSVTDVAGNVSLPMTQTGIDVRPFACSLVIADPMSSSVFLNRSHDADNNPANGLQYTLVGTSGNCPGKTVTLTKGSTTVGTTTVSQNGSFSFANGLTLADGETATFTVSVPNDAAAPSTDSLVATADLTPPQLSNVSPAVTTFAIVTSSNLNLLPTVKPGYIADSSAAAGGQIVFTFRVTGSVDGTVQLLYRGSAVGTPVTVTSSPQDLSLTDFAFSFPHDTSGVFRLVLRDEAGNEVTRDANVTVDVVPPAAPTMGVTVANARLADLSVTWTVSGDDGTTGTATGYDLRWSTELVLPSGIQTEDQYFDVTQADGDSPQVVHETGATLPASPQSRTVRVPPLNRYLVLVRAVDEVGNLSPFSPATNATETTWSTSDMTNPGAGTNFYGFRMVADTDWTGDGVNDKSDFDGDGRSDLVVGAPVGNPGAVHVYFGATDLTLMPRSDLGPGTDVGTGQAFGDDVSVGNFVTTAVGDTRPDLMVGAWAWSAARGRAFAFVGVQGQQSLGPTATLEFRGNPGTGRFGYVTKVIPDLNGDSRPELFIAAPYEGTGQAYLWYGRSLTDWQSLQRDDTTGNPCTGMTTACVIPASQADRIFVSPVGLTNPRFGLLRGYAYLGPFDVDGTPDFAVPASKETINQLVVYSGASVNSRATGATISATSPDTIGTPLTQPAAGSASTLFEGFGAQALGNLSLVDGATRDLVVSYPIRDMVFIYPDGQNGLFGSPRSITGELDMGTSLAVVDLNGDGRLDVLSGGNSAPPSASSLWLFFNRGVAGQEFDAFVRAGFAHSQLRRADGMMGVSVATGDFNGDNLLDVAGGQAVGAAAPLSWGPVRIWH